MTNELPQETAIDDPARVVEGFLYALQDEDLDSVAAVLDENIVYQNVGLPIINGRQRVLNLLGRGLEMRSAGFEVKIHRIAAEGTSVLTERTDALIFGAFRAQFWVCGVFEVRNGKITLWRDYFDFLDILKATVRGLAALAIPSLRPSL
jgi:limonene-1,2-epoxide hydrolase